MKEKPKFDGLERGTFGDVRPGYFTVIVIKSDGRNFFIELSESVIPALSKEVLERMQYILSDSIYRVRPDLQTQ